MDKDEGWIITKKIIKRILLHFGTSSITELQFRLEIEGLEPEGTEKFWLKVKELYNKECRRNEEGDKMKGLKNVLRGTEERLLRIDTTNKYNFEVSAIVNEYNKAVLNLELKAKNEGNLGETIK